MPLPILKVIKLMSEKQTQEIWIDMTCRKNAYFLFLTPSFEHVAYTKLMSGTNLDFTNYDLWQKE